MLGLLSPHSRTDPCALAVFTRDLPRAALRYVGFRQKACFHSGSGSLQTGLFDKPLLYHSRGHFFNA